MPRRGLIYRILIASPSDVEDERQIIREVIYAWNASHTLATAAILEPVMWETHARPEMGDRPQEIINRQLVDQCDVLIGTFWTRLGTHTGKAESGTAEEIEEFRKKGKPVLLYFSSKPIVPDDLDPVQYGALRKYKATLGENGLYSAYKSSDELQHKLMGHLASTLNVLHASAPESEDESDRLLAEYVVDLSATRLEQIAGLLRHCGSLPRQKIIAKLSPYMPRGTLSGLLNPDNFVKNPDGKWSVRVADSSP